MSAALTGFMHSALEGNEVARAFADLQPVAQNSGNNFQATMSVVMGRPQKVPRAPSRCVGPSERQKLGQTAAASSRMNAHIFFVDFLLLKQNLNKSGH